MRRARSSAGNWKENYPPVPATKHAGASGQARAVPTPVSLPWEASRQRHMWEPDRGPTFPERHPGLGQF